MSVRTAKTTIIPEQTSIDKIENMEIVGFAPCLSMNTTNQARHAGWIEQAWNIVTFVVSVAIMSNAFTYPDIGFLPALSHNQ